MSVLAQGFWPWFWTLALLGAMVTAVLVLIVSFMTQQRAGHQAANGAPHETPASVPKVRTVASNAHRAALNMASSPDSAAMSSQLSRLRSYR